MGLSRSRVELRPLRGLAPDASNPAVPDWSRNQALQRLPLWGFFFRAGLGRFTCSCGRSYWKHIATLLRCYEPRGAMSCGSPMPRGEQIAKPTERDTAWSALFLLPAGQEC